MEKKLLRIIDANLNRSREGLRVCEDIARLALCDKSAAKSLKAIRHAATKAVIDSKNISLLTLLQNRDVAGDKGKFLDFRIRKNSSDKLAELFMRNIERAKESLRVLEECFKMVDEKISRKYRKLRFDTYNTEKKAVFLLWPC